MRSVATVLASATLMTGQGVKTQKEVKNSAKNPAQYTAAERWSYMQEGKQVFSDAGVIGLTCDAVHIGAAESQQIDRGQLARSLNKEGKRLRDFGGQEDLLADEAPLKKPRTLVVCSDQESVQIAALNFARHHRRLFIEHIKDPGHRCWNDTWGALSDSHLAKTAMILLNVYNVKYGPWNKSGWFARVQETAKTLSQQLGPNDPLLQKFFPAILADSRRDESENTEQERKEFLQSLPTLPCITNKGPKASQNRFFSIVHAHQWLDRMWSSQGCVFAACCLLQGWANHADELWSPAGCAQDRAV
ncbi:unnamed protein product [Cladocopium goreaui]|uniref:Protein kinase domain-containing protein n=1 Tax=Cladocopium goreaui TaxID=2562237 RepID=A0A9P1D6A8_9DINO|nr:unnamed protein product [Cladocopium goreaui]CAI4016044.1 unnamed protein product [Cladocopium goreaui]